MGVLSILFTLLLAVLMIALCVAALYWAFALLGTLVEALCYVLPSIAATIGGAALWHWGSDNLAVLWIIACVVLQFTWWNKWVRGRVKLGWSAERADELLHDFQVAIHLEKFDPLKQCPRCGNRHFTVLEEKYKSYDTTDTKTKTIRHYSSDGDETGTTEIDYEVPSTSSATVKVLKCNSCSKKWYVAESGGTSVAHVPTEAKKATAHET